MLDDKHEEVDRIRWEDRFTKEMMVHRPMIYNEMKQWDLVDGIARQLAADEPTEPQWFIQWASA